jgi:MOSC domain-containing protein YiiM
MADAKIVAVSISRKKGVKKTNVDEVRLICNHGIDQDAHAGDWHRQVSLLAIESIEKFSQTSNRKIECGEFAENITTRGIVLHHLQPGELIKIDSVLLEITQIGKKCHGISCSIFSEVGNCIMPKEGIFAKVLKSGSITPGKSGLVLPGPSK